MSNNSSDLNLLFGLLALQNDFISREQLLAAMGLWLQDKSKGLDEILLERRALAEDERVLLAALVKKHLERHAHDAEKSLATISSVGISIRQELALLGDGDVDSSLVHLARPVEEYAPLPTTLTFAAPRGQRFRILRPHAEGGLGQVSVALDNELNREVALKEIQPKHADNAEMRARFVQEAEITGGLQHPGIVPVYGLGHYDNGRPFYLMRFIHGDNLKEAVNHFHRGAPRKSRQDYERVEFRKLLGRLIDVCNAVAYAHSRGVLHRDLKPGNVMVGKYGETLVVDWGLAKSVGRADIEPKTEEPTLRPSSGSGSVETMMGQAIGTPAYMSPEQAAGRLDQLQPSSDVYSLGATLYYLLTGQAAVQGNNVAETLRKVREGSFPPPRRLQARIPPALAAVCLKAMAREPQHRYPRAVDLANELELWLADEPVTAYREPATVRLGRTLRRHRTAATGLLAVLLTATLALAIFSAVIATKNAALKIARDQAEESREVAIREQARAESNLATAREIALNILEIAEQNLSNVPGQEGFRETMMDRCYAMFEEIHDQAPGDTVVAGEFAKVARMSGNLKRLMQKYAEARRRLNRSLELQEELHHAAPDDDPVGHIYLAETYRDLGTLDKATGDLAAASHALARAAEMISERIGQSADDRTLPRAQGRIDLELVGLRVDLLELEQALASATRCAATYQELVAGADPQASDPLVMMLAVDRRGQLLDRLNRRSEAAQVFEAGIRDGRVLVERNPSRDLRYALGRMLLRSAEGLVTEDPVPAETAMQIDEATKLFADLVKDFPQSQGFRYYLGDCWRVRALAHWRLEEAEKAREAFDQARSIFEKLLTDNEDPSYRIQLAQTYADFARFEQQQAGNREAARQWREQAVVNARQASQAQPANRDFQQRLESFEREPSR